ncbi:hypothetical protein L1049_011661 [Liquidambar formosana]|uniref:Uncharacterized protein n=1 Tax=Liquidambar formosana TaxID=63359 RepID=A0AAP0WX70_LIQFO
MALLVLVCSRLRILSNSSRISSRSDLGICELLWSCCGLTGISSLLCCLDVYLKFASGLDYYGALSFCSRAFFFFFFDVILAQYDRQIFWQCRLSTESKWNSFLDCGYRWGVGASLILSLSLSLSLSLDLLQKSVRLWSSNICGALGVNYSVDLFLMK